MRRKFMGLLELVLLAVGLSMDAFAVAICKGLALKRWIPGRWPWWGCGSAAFRR